MPRFLLPILILAVGAALVGGIYYWVDRIAALVVASISAAALLGLTAKKFVPRSPFELTIEQDGKILIFLTVGLGFAALNTGSNLLYLLLGILLSLIILSGLLSQRVLMYIRIFRFFPALIRANIPVVYKMTVKNRKRWFPSYHLVFAIKSEIIASGPDTFVRSVDPQDSVDVFNRITFRRRGPVQLKSLNHEASTRFPFGFFTKKRRLNMDGEVLVLPGTVPFEALPKSFQGTLRENLSKSQNDDDFLGLRPFEQGDDFKRIEWKRSTVGDELIVRQTNSKEGEDLHLWLYRSQAPTPFSPIEEYWIAVAATACEFAHKRGQRIHLHMGDVVQTLADSAPSPEPLWRTLALLETSRLPTQLGPTRAKDWQLDVSAPIPSRPTEKQVP